MADSDGFHSLDELYEHRNLLFINLCSILYDEYSRDTFWNNNGGYEGYFCLYCELRSGMISYHLPDSMKDLIYFPYKECEWDGHTSQDVIKLLRENL